MVDTPLNISTKIALVTNKVVDTVIPEILGMYAPPFKPRHSRKCVQAPDNF